MPSAPANLKGPSPMTTIARTAVTLESRESAESFARSLNRGPTFGNYGVRAVVLDSDTQGRTSVAIEGEDPIQVAIGKGYAIAKAEDVK